MYRRISAPVDVRSRASNGTVALTSQRYFVTVAPTVLEIRLFEPSYPYVMVVADPAVGVMTAPATRPAASYVNVLVPDGPLIPVTLPDRSYVYVVVPSGATCDVMRSAAS